MGVVLPPTFLALEYFEQILREVESDAHLQVIHDNEIHNASQS